MTLSNQYNFLLFITMSQTCLLCILKPASCPKKNIVEPKPDLWLILHFWLSLPLKVTFEPVCKNGFDWKDYMTKQYWRKDTQKTNIDWSSGSMYLANVKVAKSQKKILILPHLQKILCLPFFWEVWFIFIRLACVTSAQLSSLICLVGIREWLNLLVPKISHLWPTLLEPVQCSLFVLSLQ